MKNCKNCKYFNPDKIGQTGTCEAISRTTMTNDICGCYKQLYVNVNTCVSCGEIIPEGRQVCPKCETGGSDV